MARTIMLSMCVAGFVMCGGALQSAGADGGKEFFGHLRELAQHICPFADGIHGFGRMVPGILCKR